MKIENEKVENENSIQKISFFLIITTYYLLCYFFVIPKLFSDLIYIIYIISYFTLQLIDTILRPLEEEDRVRSKYDFILLLLFILGPWFTVLAYFENTMLIVYLLPFYGENLIISIIGLGLHFFGGIYTLICRYQLGKFASGFLKVSEDHKLMTNGMYKHVRNPMYTGALISTIGFGLIFRCIIMNVMLFVIYFLFFRQRIEEEERLLKEKFGKEFEDYMKKTKRLFPFIY